MKVSICITTYNHEKFIAQAMESVLMQQVDFDYEILIGEDDSGDDTREIVKQYKDKHPDKIKLFLNDRENVIYIDGRPTGRWNLINLLKHAVGEYIVLLDGDDYWTSSQKLQKQIDFLDANPDFSMCFHDAIVIYDDSSNKPHIHAELEGEEFCLEDILKSNFIATTAAMFRRESIKELPELIYKVPCGDWILHILNAQKGKIGYLNEEMSAYRQHKNGLWASLTLIKNLQMKCNFYGLLGPFLNHEYDHIIKPIMEELQTCLESELQKERRVWELNVEQKKLSGDNFLYPSFSPDNMDLYQIRTSILNALKEFLPKCKGILLDVGCGEMPYRPLILGQYENITQYIGLDIENPNYHRDSLPGIIWDGTQIPLDDCSVDCAIATELFEHLPSPELVMQEIHRVLKPNGLLFFTVPFLWPLHDVPHDEYRYTPFSLERHLTNGGFGSVEIKALGGWNESLAQMIGLWLTRKPMTEKVRQRYKKKLFPFYKTLLETKDVPESFTESQFITGLSGVAVKGAARR